MREFNEGVRPVRVNDTESDIVLVESDAAQDVIESCISELVCLPPEARNCFARPKPSDANVERWEGHSGLARALVRCHADGHALLSPLSFTTCAGDRFTNLAVDTILRTSPLGLSLVKDLGGAGLSGFVERLGTRDSKALFSKMLNRLLASLCMSMSGVDKAADIPCDAYIAWLNFFRDENKARWRRELWPGRVDHAAKCLREITAAYGRLTGRSDVVTAAAVKRSDAASNRFWADIWLSPPAHIQPWLELFLAWRNSQPAFAKNYRQMFLHLVTWFDECFGRDDVSDVGAFLSKKDRTPSFAGFLVARRDRATKPYASGTLVQHLNYAHRFSLFLAGELSLRLEGQPVFHLVTEADISGVRNFLGKGGRAKRHAEAKSRPLPMRLHRLAREILEEGEKGWPGTCSACLEDVALPGRRSARVYCPVLPTLFLSIFHLPLRVGQMKRLDSGEGDVSRFDGHLRSWGTNTGPNAGYWHSPVRAQEDRGFAQRIGSERPITGFSVNTNKGGEPYVVPWENKDLHKLLHDVRLWQEEYNPISGPIGPMLYIDGIEEADKAKAADYPDIFPLFRLPPDTRTSRPSAPPSSGCTQNFWNLLMAEVERRWNEAEAPENHIRIVKRQIKTGQPYGAKYNPHGLRVSGLTELLQQNVPIGIVSKLVAGHRTILLTLYYMKLDPATVHDALEEARQRQDAVAADAFTRDIRNAQFEAAQRKAAYIHEDGLRAAVAMDWVDKALWIDTGLGTCPWDGVRCKDGGPVLRKDQRPNGAKFDVHGPVEGGERNCVLCRHFWTGPPWRTPIWLHGNKLLRALASKGSRIQALIKELDGLYGRRRGVAETADRARVTKEIGERENEVNALSREQEVIAKGIFNVNRLLVAFDEIEKSEAAGAGRSGSRALVAQDQTSVIEYVERTEFEQAALLTAGSRVYPMLRDEETEAARDRFLDAILFDSGGQPLTLTPLPLDVKRRALDSFARVLLERLEHEEIRALTEGAIRLNDLPVAGEAVAAIASVVGRPTALGPPSRRAVPIATEAVTG